MTLAKPTLSGALQKAKEPERRKREKIYNEKSTPARRGKRGMTLYLDPVAHAALKRISENEDKLLQDLLKEGVNLVLQRYGEKPIA